MEIIKTVITTLDILLILLFFTFGKTAKDKTTAIGFGSIIMWYLLLATNFKRVRKNT